MYWQIHSFFKKKELYETRSAILSQAKELKKSAEANKELVQANKELTYLNVMIANQNAFESQSDRLLKKIDLLTSNQHAGGVMFVELDQNESQLSMLVERYKKFEAANMEGHQEFVKYIQKNKAQYS